MRILINGNFLNRPLTGIERFAFESVSALDKIADSSCDIALFAAHDAALRDLHCKNIRLIQCKKPLRSFPLWDMGVFASQCKKSGRKALSFSNTAPLGRQCGAAFIHDVYCKDFPDDFVTPHEKAVAFYTDFMCRNICRNASQVLTVSKFSAERIALHYHIDIGRIKVVTNGWEHFKRVVPDDGIFSRFGQLQRGNYYFTLGSLQKRKNLKWVLQAAKGHPNDTFVIAGGAVSGYAAGELGELHRMQNICLTGRISDGEVKALMLGCKAFLFPSLYEGFGIPPLEALSCGAKVIVSDIPVFHEIYECSVHYADPLRAECDLDALLKEETFGADKVLIKHTYKEAAKALKEGVDSGQ